MKRIFSSHTHEKTFEIAKNLGKTAGKGDIFALYGDLGSGKTVMAKGIASGMGIKEEVTSPTFNLLEVYDGRLTLYHFDLYRIESEKELDMLFFEEYWEGDGVSVIEWAERAGTRLPERIIRVGLEYVDETTRRISIEYPDD
ncbi:MAG: tRNA (adenosine(37)-N6)-threonylcarbamoyltransferase complex ATPase subunit type 1 TsaE [Spirochaetes bacterium]|jgi:tRNA threonylcarbamoyladenosine biosynthesis protein TsaE|nr:tRNA (adenosine(37)-N6)-threonylcarbamoyltransferase complex ATPase subunit type 1 TsaE [Spirochaetota bacterium]